MNRFLKKFLDNELAGLKGIFKHYQKGLDISNYPKEEITQETQPFLHEIIKDISDKANVYPKAVELTGRDDDDSGKHKRSRKIEIGRGNLQSKDAFEWTYAHELGHEKHNNLHGVINWVNVPYNYLLKSTTCLYTVGLMASPLTSKVLNAANYTFEHTGKLLLAGALLNAVTIRVREYMADTFAYKHTGILPSKAIDATKSERKGVIGNTSKIVGDILAKAQSGYPLKSERDLVCKIFGKKPKTTSFTEQINAERQQPDGLSNESRLL